MSQKWNFDYKENNFENGGKAGHQDFLLFLNFFNDLSFLNTGKIVHIFHLKANSVGEGKNASNQHFLLFLCCFFKDFFLSGVKSHDCLGEESNVEKRNKTMHLLNLT